MSIKVSRTSEELVIPGRHSARRWLPYAISVVAGLVVIAATYVIVRPDPAGCVPLRVNSSSEKSSLIGKLAERYNKSRGRDVAGRCATVTVQGMNSGEAMNELAGGWAGSSPVPQVWLPASSLWIGQLRQLNRDALLPREDHPVIASSPLVIALPKEKGLLLQERGTLGWGEILGAPSQDGWATFGHPELGNFTFSKDNPALSTSGLAATIATYYAASGKEGGSTLTLDDLEKDAVTAYVRGIEANVSHYTDDVVDLLKRHAEADLSLDGEAGVTDLNAIVMQESLVYQYNRGEMSPSSGSSGEPVRPRVPLIALHPREGTYDLDHPYVVLPSTDQQQRQIADDFHEFLLEKPQQEEFQLFGFRDHRRTPSAELSRWTHARGAPRDPFKEPAPEVVTKILEGWNKLSKKANILVAIDTSTSMNAQSGNRSRFERATEATRKALALLGTEDKVALWSFSTETKQHPDAPFKPEVRLSRLDQGALTEKLDKLKADGPGTALYTTVRAAHRHMVENYAPDRINAVVVLTDGRNEYDADNNLARLLRDVKLDPRKPVRIFCIAFDRDSDLGSLEEIAKTSGGKAFDARDPARIEDAFRAVVHSFGAR
ncbi:substrate-binding and VWA domain-containing protein [Micromonospora sonneratiae]